MTVESPFLPNTHIQYAWDSTSLSYLKICPRLYYYTMIEGWSTKEESVHLRFGIEYHHALQSYDLLTASGIKHDDALHDVVRELCLRTVDFVSDHKTKTRPNLIRTVIWYLDKHKDDPSTTHILPSGKPAVEQSFRHELNYGPSTNKQGFGHFKYVLCGHLDKVVEFSGDLFVKDYKTVYTFWGKKWEPDNQMTLYALAAKIVLDSPVRGVIIDMAQVKENETEFKRDITYRTPDQLEEWLDDQRYWFELAERHAVEDHWPMNDTACDKFGGCRFRDICSQQASVRQAFLESNFIQLPEDKLWNPLRPR